MHSQVIDFLERVRWFRPGVFCPDRAVEFGARIINGSARYLFHAGLYTGVDALAGPGVDEVSKARDWQPAQGSEPIDVVLSFEMLEHDKEWKASVARMVEIVRDGGTVLITSAAPGRPVHEVDCGPPEFENWYQPISAIEVVQYLRELSEWSMLWAEQASAPADTYVAAIGKKPGAPRPTTSVVIPVVNNAAMTGVCVVSIRTNIQHRTEIVLVDNGSTPDESRRHIATAPEVYLRYDTLLGYPAAVNRGIRAAAGQYVALLNNDTAMQTEGWDERLIQALPNQFDMVSPVFDYVGNMDQLDDGTRSDVYEARVLFFVMVFCHRRIFQKVGLLDERFGLGNSEDVDFSARIVQAGGRLWIDPGVKVHHKGHQTFGQLMSRDDFQSLIRSNHDKLIAKWQ